MRLVTATLVVFGLLSGAEASTDDVAKVEKSKETDTPMMRVIELVKGLKLEIIKDGKMEQQLFDKYQCWCERSVREATTTIGEAEEQLETDQNRIDELSSDLAANAENLDYTMKNIASNRKSKKDAEEQRQSENESFEAELNNDMTKLGALEHVIKILQDNKASAGGQDVPQEEELLSKSMKTVMDSVVVDQSIAESDKKAIVSFAKAPAQFFQSSAGGIKAYESQSGVIIGIMKSMLLATASDAQDRSAAEVKAVIAFQHLINNLDAEHASLIGKKNGLETSTASKEEEQATTKARKAATQETLKLETAFKADTTAACKEKAKEWALRSQLRLEELKNLDKGIAILSDIGSADEQAFNKAGEGEFLQLETTNKLRKIQRELAQVALETGSHEVAELVATSTRSGSWHDAMHQVTGMIKRMIKSHEEQGKRDRELRQECQNHATLLESEKAAQERTAAQQRAKADALESAIGENGGRIAELNTEIGQDEGTLTNLLNNANEAERKMKSDLGQREHAIDTIKKAIVVIGASCKANKATSFLQLGGEPGMYKTDKKKAPKADFSSADKHCQSTEGLISIMQMILQDLHNETEELKQELGVTKRETNAQSKDLRQAIDSNEEEVASLKAENGDMEVEKEAAEQMEIDTNAAASATGGEITANESTCANVLNDTIFNQRQADRQTEKEALQYALTVLTTGASGTSFLQARVSRH